MSRQSRAECDSEKYPIKSPQFDLSSTRATNHSSAGLEVSDDSTPKSGSSSNSKNKVSVRQLSRKFVGLFWLRIFIKNQSISQSIS